MKLRKVKGHNFIFRMMPFEGNTCGYDISRIAKIENNDQLKALVLFRQAMCSNNAYLACLFFWHVLNVGKKGVVNWINTTFENPNFYIEPRLLDSVLPKGMKLGECLKRDYRHAIAHILQKKAGSGSRIVEKGDSKSGEKQSMKGTENFAISCPSPVGKYQNISLAHGGGGRLTHQLIEDVFLPAFKNGHLSTQHDGAVIQAGGTKLAFTTDSYVVQPLFFPGGDIGALGVNGTVNDLAMCGARPLYLSAGFILEEGLSMETLTAVVESMKKAAESAGVQFVTGDTKVVDKGKGDGLFLNTAGIGIIEHDLVIEPASVRAGDLVVLSGDVGRHGIAIMAAREGIDFKTAIQSDCASLSGLVIKLLDSGVNIHCMRDLTRGGLATALVEIALTARVQITIEEYSVPVTEEVKGACEILGFDPLYVANEGRFIMFIPPGESECALSVMKTHPQGSDAVVIGKVAENKSPLVTAKNKFGTSRILDMLSGSQLPRIC